MHETDLSGDADHGSHGKLVTGTNKTCNKSERLVSIARRYS